jgi:hypothetical protein
VRERWTSTQTRECPPTYPDFPEFAFAVEWRGWDDFFDPPYPYLRARELVQELKLASPAEYFDYGEKHDPDERLPRNPAAVYGTFWAGWTRSSGRRSAPHARHKTTTSRAGSASFRR